MSVIETVMQTESERAALAWARSLMAVQAVEALGEKDDGSKTFRLDTDGQVALLKVLPEHRAPRLTNIAGVAQRFPREVPQVLAVDAKMGWLLTSHHDAVLSSDRREREMALLLSSLASIQTRACVDLAFLDGLAPFDPSAMPQQLLAFLERHTAEDGSVPSMPGADSFMGIKSAQRYLRLFRARLPLLQRHVAGAMALPRTLVHGDLRVRNGALRDDGTCVVTDWDECAAGPAGTCLYGVFDGCAVPAILLSRWASSGSPADTEDGRLLAGYVRALVAGGYATEPALLAGLASAMCAGQIRAIVNCEQFPLLAGSRHVSIRLHERLENLLDLCDWLSARDHDLAMAMVADYQDKGEYHGDFVRARALLQDQVARHPDRADLYGRFGVLSRQLGEIEIAAEACREATRLDPTNPNWWLELAQACLGKLDFEGCREGMERAQTVNLLSPEVVALQQRLEEISGIAKAAAEPGGWPQVRISEAERARGKMDPERLALVAMLFKKYGAVQLDNVFDPAYIETLHQLFLKRHEKELDEKAQGDNLVVGDKRFMLTMQMEEEFGSPDFYASGLLLPAMKRILGDDLILNSYTTVISLPGSELQHVHKDHTALFEPEGGWHMNLPCFVAQIIVPLVPMNLSTGSTRTIMGSQALDFDEVEGMPYHDPILPTGSCLLIDYATVHYGLPNVSGRIRPIVCFGYAKPWFRDFWNYNLQAPMQFTHAYFKSQREEVRKLLAWRDNERRNANRE